MDESLADWLALREPVDVASRSEAIAGAVLATLPGEGTIRALDLATGTGSNLRYLLERLGPRQSWLVADRSAGLLAALMQRTADWARGYGCALARQDRRLHLTGPNRDWSIETTPLDLHALPGPLFEGRHLVTASALLDLVSDAWLMRLADLCRASGASVLLTLSYNGHSRCFPVEAEDDAVRDLFNRHQLRDKGLGGPAAGPGAAALAITRLADAGYVVQHAASNWVLGPSLARLQALLIEGWASASTEVAPEQAAAIAAWRERRLAHVTHGRSSIVVGHTDIGARPA